MPSGEAPANIRVLVRVRPLNKREIQSSPDDAGVLQIRNNDGMMPPLQFGVGNSNDDQESEGTICIEQAYLSYIGATPGRRASSAIQSRSFMYDAVFGPQSTQGEIFDSVEGIIDAVCAGYNGTVVAYGQTGLGKTNTIFGEEGRM